MTQACTARFTKAKTVGGSRIRRRALNGAGKAARGVTRGGKFGKSRRSEVPGALPSKSSLLSLLA